MPPGTAPSPRQRLHPRTGCSPLICVQPVRTSRKDEGDCLLCHTGPPWNVATEMGARFSHRFA